MKKRITFLLAAAFTAAAALLLFAAPTDMALALLGASGVGMAVTAAQVLRRQKGDRANLPVAASTTIYEGTLVFSTATGYADDDTGSGANRFAGIAETGADNSAGSAGDKTVELLSEGVFELVGSGFSQADVGRNCYASDNYTVVVAQTASTVPIGRIVEYVSSTKVRVKLDTGSNLEHISATISVAAEDTNVVAVTIQLHDRYGGDLAVAGVVYGYISSDAAGQALSAAHDGGCAIGTDGLMIETLADQAFWLISEADGDIDIEFTDSGAFTAYLVLIMPDGRRVISAVMTHTA